VPPGGGVYVDIHRIQNHNQAMKQPGVKQPLALRARPETLDRLRRRAHESGQSKAALAERYIEEGIRRDEHPLIYFRDGQSGRRPAIVGTRLDVWQLIETLRANGNSIEETADYLELPVQKVRGGLRYYGDYQAEIDDWIERAKTISAREEERWRREQSLLD
jgi:uncharacterized protein (DUF433 family)